MTIRRSGYRPRGSRKTTDWGVGPQAVGFSVTASGKNVWSSGTTLAQNFTLLRTRGYIDYFLTVATAAGDGFAGASGIFMATEDAFTAGSGSLLGPLSDATSDMWIWHSFFSVRVITTTLADGVNAGVAHYRQIIDSKAMRKDFDSDRVMCGVTEVTEIGTATMLMGAETR